MTPNHDFQNTRFFRMLGFARRAGRLAFGASLTLDAVRHKRAHLVVLSAHASEGTKKQIRNKCAFYKVPLCTVNTPPEELASFLGKDASVVSVAVLDAQFASELLKSSGKEGSEQSEHGI